MIPGELTGIPPSRGETLDAKEGDTGIYLSPLLEGSTNTGTTGLGVGGRRISGDSGGATWSGGSTIRGIILYG